MNPRASTPDLEGWIRDRIHHGEHVVVRTLYSHSLLHPGCGPGACEYSGREISVAPTAEDPVYVAEFADDGTIRPREHARWEDIVRDEDPDSYRARNPD